MVIPEAWRTWVQWGKPGGWLTSPTMLAISSQKIKALSWEGPCHSASSSCVSVAARTRHSYLTTHLFYSQFINPTLKRPKSSEGTGYETRGKAELERKVCVWSQFYQNPRQEQGKMVLAPLGLRCLHLENDVWKSSHHGYGGRPQINWLQVEDFRFQ